MNETSLKTSSGKCNNLMFERRRVCECEGTFTLHPTPSLPHSSPDTLMLLHSLSFSCLTLTPLALPCFFTPLSLSPFLSSFFSPFLLPSSFYPPFPLFFIFTLLPPFFLSFPFFLLSLLSLFSFISLRSLPSLFSLLSLLPFFTLLSPSFLYPDSPFPTSFFYPYYCGIQNTSKSKL